MLALFTQCTKKIKSQEPLKPVDNYTKLEFYSLYKQATIGDVNITRPILFDYEGKAKWDAWKSKETMKKDDAMYNYIELTNKYYK